MRIFVAAIVVLTLAACGKSPLVRNEYVSDCALSAPIELGGDPMRGEILLTSVRFHVPPETNMWHHDGPSELSLFALQIDGKPHEDLLGARLNKGSGAGFEKSYAGPLEKASVTDEEGVHFHYPPSRQIGGRKRQEGANTVFVTRMAEQAISYDEKKKDTHPSDKNLSTGLRVVMEGTKLKGLEINWPVSKSDEWRMGPLKLPVLERWQAKNERLCLESAELKR